MRIGRKSASEDLEATDRDQKLSCEAPSGPFDVSEVDLEERECVDLGSLLVTPVEPMELQLQVDEESGQVMAVVLVADEGALELRAFAASRGGGAWDELRPRIAAEMARMGGTADEQEGTLRHRAAVHGADADPGRRAGHPAQPDRGPRGSRPGCCARR